MLLSICIPTKNRAAFLAQSLESLTSQSRFLNHSDIEIIISDNCSNDYTKEIATRYLRQFPDRIKYYRATEDIGADRNTGKSLSLGSGTFLKPANDTIIWHPKSLDFLCEIINSTANTKPLIYFSNSSTAPNDFEAFNDPDSLLKKLSYQITWIGSMGFWKAHFEAEDDYEKKASLNLPHVDYALRLSKSNPTSLLVKTSFGRVLPSGPKGGYNIATVFGRNYLEILESHADLISLQTIKSEKRIMLEQMILPFGFDRNHDFYPLDLMTDLQIYAEESYFKESVNRAINRQNIELNEPNAYKKIWRARNPLNETTAEKPFDQSKVKVGRRTYGPLYVHTWGAPEERLSIGNYCSIADQVHFLLGGNHHHKGISTFPTKVKLLGFATEALSKGPIEVGDDVWIGHDCIVLSGVKIGQGSVIAAGTVVSRDVPPYSIFAGNPGKVISERFEPETIKKLLRIHYAAISDETMRELGEKLYAEAGTDDFEFSINRLIEATEFNEHRSF